MYKQLIIIVFINGILNPLFGQSQTGIASVRHLAHEGTITKTGQYFSHDSLVASHRSIPFGSLVKVTNLKNQKSVDVIINDRGPFIRGYIIDLSESAANKIEIQARNPAEVRIDILKLEEEFKFQNFETYQANEGNFGIKIGSFGDKQNATDYAKKLFLDYKLQNISMKVSKYKDSPIYNIFIGRFQSREFAEKYLSQLPKNLQSGYVTTID